MKCKIRIHWSGGFLEISDLIHCSKKAADKWFVKAYSHSGEPIEKHNTLLQQNGETHRYSIDEIQNH
jgi:hypothetical protein